MTPNTAVYTPKGVVHRFQMFSPYENTAIVTPLEGKKRAAHILVGQEQPVPASRGFVVPGRCNDGPFPHPGERCPVAEFREIPFGAGDTLADGDLDANEHWIVSEGEIRLVVDGNEIALVEEDVALMRSGVRRRVQAIGDGRAVLVRER